MQNFKYNLKKYFGFSRTELVHYMTVVLVLGFAFSFNQWGTTEFDFLIGLQNLAIALLIAGISVFAHHAVQRITAVAYGFRAEHRIWIPGIIACLFLVVFSNGRLFFLAASSVWLHMIPALRIGKKPYGISQHPHFGFIALSGPLANLIIAAIAGLFAGPLAAKIAGFNILFAVFNLLPLPPLDGAHVFFSSRLTYVFTSCAVLGYILSSVFLQLSFFANTLIAAVTGLACWLLFFLIFERKF